MTQNFHVIILILTPGSSSTNLKMGTFLKLVLMTSLNRTACTAGQLIPLFLQQLTFTSVIFWLSKQLKRWYLTRSYLAPGVVQPPNVFSRYKATSRVRWSCSFPAPTCTPRGRPSSFRPRGHCVTGSPRVLMIPGERMWTEDVTGGPCGTD